MTHKVSESAADDFWKNGMMAFHQLQLLREQEQVRKNVPTFVHQRRKLFEEMNPSIESKSVFRDKTNGTIVTVDTTKRSARQYQNSRYEKLYDEAHIKAEEIHKIHRKICRRGRQIQNPKIKLSLDGVQESKSSTVSLETFSINFIGCRTIYPIRLIRPHHKFKFDEQIQIGEVVNDINESDIIIDTCVLDKPMRSKMRNFQGQCAKYPCEYCEACAVTLFDPKNAPSIELTKKRYKQQIDNIKEKIELMRQAPGTSRAKEQDERKIVSLLQTIDELKLEENNELKMYKKSHLTWPASTMNGRPRTITSIRRIVAEIEQSEVNLPNEVKKGIKGHSVLLFQPNFDFITDFPCEYMHSVCQGAVKRTVELTFNVGEKRYRVTKRKRSNPDLYNEKIKLVDSPREFSRRCRYLDFSVFKAQDYRNLLLFFFPIVIECIEIEFVKERKLWLSLVFIIRACILPNNEYENVQQRTIYAACELFYNLYEEVYGAKNCTYSIHIVGSHILKIRGNCPLTEKSAFMFESYFSEMKNLFQPGTQAPLKQILKNTIMKRQIEYHTCEKTIFYAPEKKKGQRVESFQNKENNHTIYTYENNCHNFHNIVEVNNDLFICTKQGKFEYSNSLTETYN